MATAVESTPAPPAFKVRPWLPLAVLPAAVMLPGFHWPAWVFMWALALSIYAGLKWLTYQSQYRDTQVPARPLPAWRPWAYLLLWPGMDAAKFLSEAQAKGVRRGTAGEWTGAIARCGAGLLLVLLAARLVGSWHTLAAGWVGMIGLVTALHFGLFHVLSLYWRHEGIDAPPIMDAPLRSSSLSDFWGRRWNRAFRDVGHAYVFRPLCRRLGPAQATLAVFLVSGVVHDLVISAPARGGWGLPTVYFVLQGCGALLERSTLGRRIGLRRAVGGRLFAAAAIVLPLPLLFPPVFIERVVVPMLLAIEGVP